MSAKILGVVIALVTAISAYAEDTDLVIVGWLDHLTFGAPNTVVGGVILVPELTYNAIKGNKIGVRIDKTGRQVVVEGGNFSDWRNYSTGMFNHAPTTDSTNPLAINAAKDELDAHESGHGVQSSVLGLMYFPTVLGVYGLLGSYDNIMEKWADGWKGLGKSMSNSRKEGLFLEYGERDGKPIRRLGARYSLLERNSRLALDEGRYGSDDSFDVGWYDYVGLVPNKKNGRAKYPTMVSYRYGTIGVKADQSLVNDDPCHDSQFVLEGSLFQRDFLAEWQMITPALKLLIDSHQEIGTVSIDFERKDVDATFISQKTGYGVRVGHADAFAVDAEGHASFALKGRWSSGDVDPGVYGSLGLGYGARAHVLDAAEIYYNRDKEWGNDGYRLDSRTYGIETPRFFRTRTFTGEDGKQGKATKLQTGVEYTDETEKLNDVNGQSRSSRVKVLMFSINGRY